MNLIVIVLDSFRQDHISLYNRGQGPFDTYTDPAYRGPRIIMPMGGMADTWATREEQRHIQGLYTGNAHL